jgi:carboxyl-terminal processing protease
MLQDPGTDGTLPRASTFDFVWERIRDTYYDPGMRGIDWEAVRGELRPRALAAENANELRAILSEMLERLGESHFSIIPGSAAAAFAVDGEVPGGNAEPGIELRWVDDAMLVTRIREGSPAERAGVRAGWVLDAIGELGMDTLAAWVLESAPEGADRDRHLALWMPGSARRRLLGPEGAGIRLRFVDGSESTVTLDLSRAPPAGEEVRFGNLPPMRVEAEYRELGSADDIGVGVIRWSAWFPAVVPTVAEAVDSMRHADGIVLDLRGNPGGLGALAMGIGGHFLSEPVSLGAMRTRDSELRFVVNPQLVAPDGRRVEPYAGPLAVLVDPLTASTSEFFAAGLQILGRATIFGEPTAGQALPALVVELPNGDHLLHAVADFTAPDGVRLEGSGIRPDVLAPPTRETLLAGVDPALAAAVEWLRAAQEARPAVGASTESHRPAKEVSR